MSALEELKTSMGIWQGKSRLHDPNTGAPEDSLSTLTVTPTEGDAHLRLDYTWAYQGTPQQGTLRIEDKFPEQVTAYWTDTWHMGDETMHCVGTVESDDALALRGTYGAPPGLYWGWRIVVHAGDSVQMTMYNISPEGQEDIAVEATYSHLQ